MRIYTLSLLMCSFLATNIFAQNSGFIYGEVHTEEGNTYTGQIRWGKEEAFWTDMFNAAKIGNDFIDDLPYEEERKFRERRKYRRENTIFGINISTTEWENNSTHQFSCQFGDIERIQVVSHSRVNVILRGGQKIRLSGEGYNDIGADVQIFSSNIGEIKMDWNDIEEVVFLNTPSGFRSAIGSPLYGTVYTSQGEFEGLIQWDKDERIGEDKLDGENSEGDFSIPFQNIKSIARSGRGVSVRLHEGRELRLSGTNDVNDGNRGIIITNPALGRVVVKWEDFDKVEFQKMDDVKLKPYRDFGDARKISASVLTREGVTYKGDIAYDLDESMELEILDGKIDDYEFQIPFRNIASIKPISGHRSEVVLNSGQKLILEDARDVSEGNDGVLIYKGSGDPLYVSWAEVDEIKID